MNVHLLTSFLIPGINLTYFLNLTQVVTLLLDDFVKQSRANNSYKNGTNFYTFSTNTIQIIHFTLK